MSLPDPATGATIVVTGASAGIGAELARQLAALGHHVTLVARRRERLDALAAELGPARAAVHSADLTAPGAGAALVAEVEADGAVLAGLVNNAGFGSYGRFDLLAQDNERRMVALNVAALHELCGAVVPGMVARGAGAILNVGSIAGVQPLPGQATYSATKAFVNTFSEALHAELRPHGVSCTALMPGPVVTEFDTVAGMEDMADRLPAPAWLSAEEVARQGVAAMRRGRRTVTPGAANRAISTATRHLPRGVLLPLMARRGSGRMARPRPQVS